MSSGTVYDPNAARDIFSTADKQFMSKNGRLGMTPRQQSLNRLWAQYRCVQYASRKIDWDGTERSDPIEHEAIATAGFIPPGFYNADSLPLKYRKPSTPYALAKVIVDRFTGLLFSERRHPQLRVEGDPQTEDYVQAIIEQSRLWPTMILARTYGGAMGSVAVGFSFVQGKPIIEVYDPRWCSPIFTDRATKRLKAIEIRYQYPETMQDPETGMWVEVPFWYRRVITQEQDVIFKPAPVGDGTEPAWQTDWTAQHNFGFCPVVWCQNIPVLDDIDGDCDFHGTQELMASIDALLSQAQRGTLANGDPTVVLTTDADLNSVSKGSNNAIKLPAGSDAKYLEINGQSAKSSVELAEHYRRYALEVTQCVLDSGSDNNAPKTATEITRRFFSMLSKADVLREQYGEKLVKPIIEMMLSAAKALNEPKVTEDGLIVRQALTLPPRIVEKGGSLETVNRHLGPGGVLTLRWPEYFEPTYTDAKEAAQAISMAKSANVVDEETAVQYMAPFFKVQNPAEMLRRLREEAQVKMAQLDAGMFDALKAEGMPTASDMREAALPREDTAGE